MIAIVAVYGVARMAETMFGACVSEIRGVLEHGQNPAGCAIVLLLVLVLHLLRRRWRYFRWLSVSIRRMYFLRRHVMATIYPADLQKRFLAAIRFYGRSGTTVLAASSLTTASFCRV